jgi:hypothetical protein
MRVKELPCVERAAPAIETEDGPEPRFPYLPVQDNRRENFINDRYGFSPEGSG